ncbi:MAG: ice-binding family protein [Patescibacteria group bacterium]|nr:ice-binding family protein [Patescibacteria group bacterium]
MKQRIVITTVALFIFALFGFVGPIAALAAGPATVNLLSAGNFTILTETGITNTGTHGSVITGNIGSSPITAAAMNGVFCSEITGTIYGVNAAYIGSGSQVCFAGNPPLANKTFVDTAVSDMEAAYTNAAGRITPDGTNLYAGNLGGQTFAPGLYTWTTDVTIPTNVTLSGGANDVWIFQIAGNLDVSSAGSIPAGIKVLLSGGAQASNVFWQVGGGTGATLGTYATFNGTILSAKQIIMQTGAVLTGRALAQTQVTLDANAVTIPAGSVSATLHVIKLVVNDNGGTAIPSAFTVHVKLSGTDIAGSPASGTEAPGTAYSLSAGTYVVSENAHALYTQSFSGACDANGIVTLSAGEDKTCTIVNTNIPPPAPVIGVAGRIIPLIGILKVPSLLATSTGSGMVTYAYTAWNVGGQQALMDVTVTDNKCGPVIFLSGDTNSNGKLDPREYWKYNCTATLPSTTTGTAVATGYSNDGFHQATIATALTTVAVGIPLPPPLISIVKVPSRLTSFPFGGGNVMYSYTVTNPGVVPMNNVVVTDDKCAPVSGPFGDANGNNLLDPGEGWAYACQTHISVSTRNVATAEGRANSFTALGYAFATVLVDDVAPVSVSDPDPDPVVTSILIPGFPDTGFPSDEESMPWDMVIVMGILVITSTSLAFLFGRYKS